VAVSLWSVGIVAAGGVLVYSAVYDPPGGPVAVLGDLLRGRAPTAGTQRRANIGVIGGSQAGPKTGSGAGSAQGRQVVEAAKSYIGVPYRWAGASRSGVDCSGLVMLAYRTIGIQLPHLANTQMRRGRIIPASAARPGDLVGWPSPAHYSHIGILVDSGHTIEAQTTGTRVNIFPIGNRAGGAPTFARLVTD
jgi:cell wall-associated NlpC family hydrolase